MPGRKVPPVTLLDLDRQADGRMLFVPDITDLLGLQRQMVVAMIKGGDIRGCRIGATYRVPWRSMRAYLRRIHILPLRPDERL